MDCPKPRRTSRETEWSERRLQTKQTLRIDCLMNPWRETVLQRDGEREISRRTGGGGRKKWLLRERPADSESEWGNDVENVITVSI